jgi:hypothetical protein
MEDEMISGKLVTYWRQSSQSVDSGLRFKEVETD